MATAYHTHTFSVPTADAADLLAGTESGKVITPDVLGPVTPAGKALLSAANVAAQRAALDLEPGTDVQAYDADLTALAGLDKSDGNIIVGNGTAWVAESGATARASLGLIIGTDVQAYSANLTEYAAVNPTTAGLALLDDVDASAQRTTLGLAIGTDVQAYDAELTALAGLDKSDGNFIVGDGSTWVAENGLTAQASLGLNTTRIATIAAGASLNLSGWDQVIVNRYASGSPLSPALYRKVVADPGHGGAWQDAAGAWWELAESEPYLEMFGAKGDGVTDDAAALMAAAAYGAKRVLGRKGAVYAIGAGGVLFDSLDGFTLDLRGATIKLLAVPTTQYVQSLGKTAVKFLDCTRSGIVNGRIDGNDKASNGLGFEAGTDCFADRIEAFGGGALGQIVAAGNTRLRISHCRVRDGIGTARGMWLGNGSAPEIETDLEVTFCHAHDNPATGIVFYSNGGRACDNTCEDNNGSGLITPGASGYTVKNAVFARNTLRRNSFHGFQVDVVYSTDADINTGNVIADNICYGNNGSGIYLVHSHDCSVTGNICFDNNADAPSGSGHGILMEDRVRNIVVQGNVCYDTRSGGSRTQTSGIRLMTTISNANTIAIVGNTCRNHVSHGIIAQTNTGTTITGLTVTGNICPDNGGSGIFIAETDAGSLLGATVAGNITLGNTGVDLRVSPLYANIGPNEYVTDTNVDYQSFTDADTTPSVRGRRRWRVANTGATTITTLDDAPDGHVVEIRASNGNTTLQHTNTTFHLKGATNVTLAALQTIALEKADGNWREIWRSF